LFVHGLLGIESLVRRLLTIILSRMPVLQINVANPDELAIALEANAEPIRIHRTIFLDDYTPVVFLAGRWQSSCRIDW
jgi:hypothetical protein